MQITLKDTFTLRKEFDLNTCFREYNMQHVKLSFFDRRVWYKNNRTTVLYRCVLKTPVGTFDFNMIGRSTCAPGDKFNESVGFKIADDRAVSKAYKKAGDIINRLILKLKADNDVLNAGLCKCDRQCVRAKRMEKDIIKELDGRN